MPPTAVDAPTGTRARKLRSVELLRGIAALLVVLSHASSTIAGHPALHYGTFFGGLLIPGTPGVEFFFVLSGFVMMTAHGHQIAAPSPVGRYAWRRVTRIYPLFWVVMAEIVWRYWGAPSITLAAVADWASLAPISNQNLVVVAWTLRQEVTFYLLFGLVLLLPRGWAMLGLWAAGVLAFQLAPWIFAPFPIVAGFLFSAFTAEFFAGLLIGWLLPRLRWLDWAWAAASLAGLVLLLLRLSADGWGAQYGPFGARLVYSAAYGLIILGLTGLERAGRYRLGRWAAVAGALSYPLYLSHLSVLDHMAGWIGRTGLDARIGQGALLAVFVAGALTVAGALAYLVDRPLQRLLRQPWFSRQASRPGLPDKAASSTPT